MIVPQVPRGDRLDGQSLTQFYVTTASGQQIPLSTVVSVETATQPNSLTQYNQLNSATFSAVPMPGVSMGQAVPFLENQAQSLPNGYFHDFLSESRENLPEGKHPIPTFVFPIPVLFPVLPAPLERP